MITDVSEQLGLYVDTRGSLHKQPPKREVVCWQDDRAVDPVAVE